MVEGRWGDGIAGIRGHCGFTWCHCVIAMKGGEARDSREDMRGACKSRKKHGGGEVKSGLWKGSRLLDKFCGALALSSSYRDRLISEGSLSSSLFIYGSF